MGREKGRKEGREDNKRTGNLICVVLGQGHNLLKGSKVIGLPSIDRSAALGSQINYLHLLL